MAKAEAEFIVDPDAMIDMGHGDKMTADEFIDAIVERYGRGCIRLNDEGNIVVKVECTIDEEKQLVSIARRAESE